jgi:hypothetical protein
LPFPPQSAAAAIRTFVVAAILAVGCSPDQNANARQAPPMQTEPQTYYYLELQMAAVQVTVTVNGMPEVQRRVPISASYQAPINENLVGTDNAVRVTVAPTVRGDGTPTPLAEMQVVGQIKRYAPGTKYATPEGGEVLASFSLQETLAAQRAERLRRFNAELEAVAPNQRATLALEQAGRTTPTLPLVMEASFDSDDVPSFAHRLRHSPVLADTARLRDYGVRLRDLLRRRAAAAFYHTAYAVKDRDYNMAYPAHREPDGSWFIEGELKESIFPNGPRLDFERDDIGMRAWCGGRVWELYVEDGTPFGRPFIQTKGLKDAVGTIAVYVAEVDGELQIIR